MVIGASWNGARAFTSTAGPGISLMNELLGLAYYAEIPAVIIDVQRVGPSTGMPTRTQQGDIFECAYASHGDTKHILLFPSNPAECFEFARQSVRSGRTLPDAGLHAVRSRHRHERLGGAAPQMGRFLQPDRGRVLTAERARKDAEVFQRYFHEDGITVAARTLPGVHPKGAFFTRGSGHNKFGGYTEIAGRISGSDGPPAAQAQSGRADSFPRPIIRAARRRAVGVITIGGCDPAVREALDILAAQGMPADFMRDARVSRSTSRSRNSSDEHEFCFVVEQNRDAQLRSLLTARNQRAERANCVPCWSTADSRSAPSTC